MNELEDWVVEILVNPLTKISTTPSNFNLVEGVIDARVYLKNTYGFSEWETGQKAFEDWESNALGYEIDDYKREIEYDRPIYDEFQLEGDLLDVGGQSGAVREFLSKSVRYVSIDPFVETIRKIPKAKLEAYECMSKNFNFIGAVAEFLPFKQESFDWVHMRSMLDHVQVPDLALKEAFRVLKPNGSLLVGMYVEGGKSGKKSPMGHLKHMMIEVSGILGIDKYKDHHTWHPTYNNLLKLLEDNDFEIVKTYWQPYWNDQVVYVLGKKSG